MPMSSSLLPKKSLLGFLLLCFILPTWGQNVRAKYNFNPSWKLFVGDAKGAEAPDFNDADWKAVTLPHAWNEDAAFKVSIDQHPTGIAWYRKHFVLPQNTQGKKIFIEFEGVRQAGEVYLNGQYVGIHENGVMAFGFDISQWINYDGDNVIAVY
jgi:beta-galactosidase/beta-glucuronidase